MIVRVEKRRSWTTVENTPIHDEELSFRAVGVLLYLLSKPNNWEANYRQLALAHTEGQQAVLAALKELTSRGYMERRRERDPETGRWRWVQVIYECPDCDKEADLAVPREPTHGPTSANADSRDMGNRDMGNRVTETGVGISTREQEHEEQGLTKKEPPAANAAALRPDLNDLCAYLADRVYAHRGGEGKPAVTARWLNDMRLLVDVGELGVEDHAPRAPDRVRACIDAVFNDLAEPGRDGFCWANQIRSPAALREHWVQIRDAVKQKRKAPAALSRPRRDANQPARERLYGQLGVRRQT